MSKNLIKLLISSFLLIAFIGLSVLFTLKNVTITDSIKFLSIQGLIDRKDDVLEKEKELVDEQQSYSQTLNKLTDSQKEFDMQKAKYESISDETIEIIKEATTQENYNMEYMWIKLGNYAKVNNLSLIVIEPGADYSVLEKNSKNDDKKKEEDTTTTTTSTGNESGTKATSSSATNQPNSNSNTEEEVDEEATVDEEAENNDTTMKIQLQGSYIDISDFIFEVENDVELKFKLDNILIEYVQGTTIKATFDVKNTIIVK